MSALLSFLMCPSAPPKDKKWLSREIQNIVVKFMFVMFLSEKPPCRNLRINLISYFSEIFLSVEKYCNCTGAEMHKPLEVLDLRHAPTHFKT